ncbi:AsmA-like C-terminal region-containing protein [Capnocytophaga sputigena]|jgi:asmA family protein|uniref:AsmA family protein n=2 Tax=Capnocytophaga sputigena TaxID=1019 RepID=UPI000BB563CE|nr:AsmA-like C-terminal region-containing protein [Capnocytophaga sputigena]PBN46347.1 AsmA family protein [Capnocytophaga sputigena]
MKIAKKIFKWGGITLLLLIIAMIAIPFFFKDTIKEKVIEMANKNLKANIALQDVDISLFKNFPKAQVTLNDFVLVNKEPFVGDTLFAAKHIDVTLSIKDLLAGNYNLLGANVKDASVYIHLNKEGVGNFDIAIPSDKPEEESAPIKLDIQQYNVENLKFTFKMDDGNLFMEVADIYHSGKGNFAEEVLDLDTQTKANVTFAMDKSTFMKQVPITLQAILGIDLKNQKYTFKQNKATVNRLDLVFDGFIQLLEEGQRYDLTFSTPTNSFQNFLALIPEEYSKSIENVKTTGNLTLKGFAKGDMVGDKIPTFGLEMYADNASFKYPNLPKTVRDITIDLKVNNTTGITNDTKVNLNKFTMSIDQDHFSARANVSNIVVNPFVDLAVKGTINLANLSQAYPISLDKKFSGILRADIATQLDMKSVETKNYQNIKAQGNLSLSQFVYAGEEFVKPFHIDNLNVAFSPSHIGLSQFDARTGETDLHLTGTIDNLYGFAFRKEILKGNFNLSSNKLVVNDFMQPAAETTTPKKETKEAPKTTTKVPAQAAIKVPAFLDCTLAAKANTVLYDNLKLSNVSGKLIIKDEKVALENLKSDIFGGNIVLSGDVSTKEKTPTFDVDLNLNRVNIPEAFSQITMLEKIAPIAKVVQGKVNTVINVKGSLKNDLTPEINSVSGDLFAALIDSKIDSHGSALLSALDSQFTGLNLNNLNLKDVKAAVDFEDGKVKIKPFTIKYKDVAIEVAGSHGFDQQMNYKLTFNVPPQMLGKEAEGLLSKLTPENQKKITNLPVVATVGGTFKKPQVSTDAKTVVKDLATQIAKNQINNLTAKGTDALQQALGSKTSSGTAGEITKTVGGLMKNRDSTMTKVKEKAKEEAKKEAKKQLGNFLKGLGGKNEGE